MCLPPGPTVHAGSPLAVVPDSANTDSRSVLSISRETHTLKKTQRSIRQYYPATSAAATATATAVTMPLLETGVNTATWSTFHL